MLKTILLASTIQTLTLNTKFSLPPHGMRDSTMNYIVIHNDGYNKDVRATRNALRFRLLSYHYFIARDGTVYQFVDPKYIARHAGISKYRGLEYWNNFSIGICLQGKDHQVYSAAQYNSLKQLLGYLYVRYPDSKDRPLLTHSQIAYPRGRKTDPSGSFNVKKIK